MSKRTVAILTGGGDCAGLNAAIRGIAKTAMTDYGWKVLGIADGYDGLINGKYWELKNADVSNICRLAERFSALPIRLVLLHMLRKRVLLQRMFLTLSSKI